MLYTLSHSYLDPRSSDLDSQRNGLTIKDHDAIQLMILRR